MTRGALVSAAVALSAIAAGCGSSKPATATTHASMPTTSTTASGPGALQAEANSAAAGDIPDNQHFILFQNPRGGYSIKYPEGWAQQGSGDAVVIRDKNNIVRIVAGPATAPTRAAVEREVQTLNGVKAQTAPQAIKVSGKPAFKVVYSTRSAPSSVTGKRVTLLVDRYYLWNGGRRAVVDLGTPQGVDNVDAYRLMIESFRWR
jgi:hypothetical protein